MAGKRSGRTSKTDHVLSLLAGAGVDREGTSSAPVDKEEVSPTPVGRESPAAQPKAETTAAPVQPTAPERRRFWRWPACIMRRCLKPSGRL